MNFKQVKVLMDQCFQSIEESAKSGEMPSLDDVNEFIRLVKRMSTFTREDWADDFEDFNYMANQLHHAVNKGELGNAIQIVESLNDAQTYCHQSHRY
ncbi:GAK system XXXCH domain-containing protein [Oceanidesulfovibrio marinus]|uniref:GAK system XXXCH domain-containing protein n=1 Tax=Oceanidesulfovibrio marinus TaxID=370038 RepID=A0A6P1ZJW0_9BACT|nr:GAK system XXXCH domain-containing protein [Oceanidesulfovibrio marinus]QJT10026.1 GAK system XXXCH domain-containing protein [Oceanidesulfovibrio marinus]TVM35856.1 hypothetical protein DQK91_04140 [Oceanidesulfovibrio marinus]